ncbi:MAG: hypothetical protein IJL21_03230 [Alphaproteobacteria bacterium]|nr:hypothetical protein [Alphaproteobacteria bacterium]
MKTKYKIIIACIITCVVTAFATVYVMKHNITGILSKHEQPVCTPDKNGCCPGETYTDMGDLGWNCCPDSGGDCFPPIEQ